MKQAMIDVKLLINDIQGKINKIKQNNFATHSFKSYNWINEGQLTDEGMAYVNGQLAAYRDILSKLEILIK